MSDLWKKFTNKNRFEDEEDDEITEDPEQEEAPAAPAASSFGKSTGASALELKVVRPETYDAVGKIADHLLNRRTVVLNLEATNKETAKRLIDFLSGVAYSINVPAVKLLNELAGRLAALGITLKWDDSAVYALADKGFDPIYGARPLRREIQNSIEDGLSEKILDSSVKKGDTVLCEFKNGKFEFNLTDQ